MSKDYNEVYLKRAEELLNSARVYVTKKEDEDGAVVQVEVRAKLSCGYGLETAREDSCGLDYELTKDLCFRSLQKRIAELETYHDLRSKNERECAMDATIGDFGWAIRRVKKGERVRRRGWNGKNQHVELAKGISYIAPDGSVVNAEHATSGNAALAFCGTSGIQLGWLASQSDMLSEDWEVVE